ncbi:hypothetical protein IC582_003361 [Cucumis melo]
MPLKPLKPSISFAQFTQIHAKLLTNPKPHIFNPLLGSLVNSISPENGLFLYNQMLHYPSSHNHFTFTYALKACCFLHQTQKGLEIHAHLIKSDVVSWTSIISGFSKLGFEKEALGNHGGLINQGMMVFEAMKDVYNISPQIRHYACMVDMYGKAGLLDEAEAFIKEMPMEAEGPVWGALLHACQIHGNEKKYEKVRECLLGSKGVTVGAFALLSNTYASCDRWNDANDVRVAMRSRGLKKMAGCSWIELVNPSNPVG